MYATHPGALGMYASFKEVAIWQKAPFALIAL